MISFILAVLLFVFAALVLFASTFLCIRFLHLYRSRSLQCGPVCQNLHSHVLLSSPPSIPTRRDRDRVGARDRQRALDEAAAAAALKADVLRVLHAQTEERRAHRDDERRRMREAAEEARQLARQAEVWERGRDPRIFNLPKSDGNM